MIQQLRNKHQGASVAIVGSGPTANQMICGQWNVGIALNKGILARPACRYWMVFDSGIVDRREQWFFDALQTADSPIFGWELWDKLSEAERAVRTARPLIKFNYKPISGPERNPAREVPVFDPGLTELTNNGNIVIPAIETAIIMGAKRIGLYGVDLAERKYFDGTAGAGEYHWRVAAYVLCLLQMCRLKGIEVEVHGSEACRIRI